MVKIFISYRSLDSTKVDTLVARLRSLKNSDGAPLYEIWQDKYSIIPGEDWWRSIVNGIDASPIFVFMLSRESAQNINCRAELSYARKRNRAILPLVLEEEFDFNPITGKNDIDYWQMIPVELNDLRAQFLFYEGTGFVRQFNQSYVEFERKGFRDIPADFPPDPRHVSDATNDTGVIYDQACDAAYRLDMATAERWFQRLVDWHDPLFGADARDWIELLRRYERMRRLAERSSTRYQVAGLWVEYKGLYPKRFIDGIFDPVNLSQSVDGKVEPITLPPKSEATPFKLQSISEQPLDLENLEKILELYPKDLIDQFKMSPSLLMGSQDKIGAISPQTSKPKILTLADIAAVRTLIGDPFDWCEIPAGEFLMGDENENDNPPRKLTLSTFWMAKYPITYNQFQVFLDAKDGFKAERWWRGLAADAEHHKEPGDQNWKIAEHPRERVSWYDAIAFCRWLSFKLGGEYALDRINEWAVRLPTVFEWEKAARGTDGRIYPYGNQFDTTKGNTADSGINRTTPVTTYPQGASPYGIVDLSGNVWEWCITDYLNPSPEIEKWSISSDNPFMLRGGSFFDSPHLARVISSEYDVPEFREENIGFRVCRPYR